MVYLEDGQRNFLVQFIIFGTFFGVTLLSQIIWKAPNSLARLKLVHGSSVWPIKFYTGFILHSLN